MSQSRFPPGTPVCVKQTVHRRACSYESEVVGVVEAWEELPTGSWHVHGRKDRHTTGGRKLWLTRLKLRKVDGEVTLLVIDDGTEIAKLETSKQLDVKKSK